MAVEMFIKNNKYGFQLNLNHPKIKELYFRYKGWKNIGFNHPMDDADRIEFENFVIKDFKKKGKPIPSWVKIKEKPKVHPFVYQQIKERITMTQVLEHYGFEVNKDFAKCPFHSDEDASLKVYSDNFYCYGCGAAGDLIKFVALHLNVENREAARILNKDFSLGLEIDSPQNSPAAEKYILQKREREKIKEFQEKTLNTLNTYHRFLHQQRQNPNDKNPLFHLSLKDLDWTEVLIQSLIENPAEFKNTYMNEVSRIEQFLKENIG